MPGSSLRSRRASIPWGIIGMLVLVAAVEGFFGRHPLDFTEHVAYSWRFGGEAARGPQSRAELICLGDSLVKHGILPRRLEKPLACSAYNLSVFGGQAPTSYYLLRRALESGAKPRALVVDFDAKLLASPAELSASLWGGLLDAREVLDLAWNTRDLNLVARTSVAKLLPSYRARMQARAALLAVVNGKTWSTQGTCHALQRNWEMNAGANVVDEPRKAAGAKEPTPRHLPRWRPSRVNSLYLRRFLDLAAAHQITVFWLLPPTDPDWQRSRERLGIDTHFEQMVRSEQERYRNLVVVDGRHAGYERTAFYDETHLNRRGALELTQAMAAVIGAHWNDPIDEHPRRVALPAFQERDLGDLPESIAESTRVMQGLVIRR